MDKKPVNARTFSGEQSSGEIEVATFTKAERIRNTVLKTGFVLLLTLVGVFVPIAHFVIVPLGLILTVIIFGKTWAATQQIVSGSAPCPACGKVVTIQKRGYALPFKDTCDSCHREVMFSEA